MSDFGNVDEFEQPDVEDHILGSIIPLIIDEGFEAEERIETDIDDLIESVGMEELRKLKEYINRGDLASSLCKHPLFIEAVERRIASYTEILNAINFDDDGNL